jgi:tetratricopeptide (TPR) repeat protein
MRFRLNLSPRARRRLDRFKSKASWYVGYPLFLISNFFRSVGGTLVAWWRRRNIRYLLQGLPALVATLGVLLFGVLVYAQDRNSVATSHRNAGIMALSSAARQMGKGEESKDQLAMAETCFQRLMTLQDNPDHRFALAQVLELKQQMGPAIELIKSLAPETAVQAKPGYGPAHLVMAELYLSNRLPPPPGSNPSRAAELHLIRALQTRAIASRAHMRLYDLYRLWNKPEEAEKHLEEAAKVSPEARLVLARWYFAKGKADRGKFNAAAAGEAFRQRLDEKVDDHGARLSYADALLLVGDFPAALEVLRQGATLAQTTLDLQANYAVRASALYNAWYDAKSKDPKSTPAERFAMLEQSLKWFPNNGDTFVRLMAFARQKGPDADKARQTVRDLATGGEASFLAHLYLGIDAWQNDNPAEARYHWEKAFALDKDKNSTLVANNLAWVVAFHEPTDPPRALSMIDAAIEKAPGDPRFRGTRGHILAKMERHKEALPDLEAAIPAYPNDERLFRQLAESCRILNMPKMAEDYKRRADEIREKSKPKTPASAFTPDAKPGDAPKDGPAGTPPPDAKPPDAKGGSDQPKAPPTGPGKAGSPPKP